MESEEGGRRKYGKIKGAKKMDGSEVVREEVE